MIRINKITDYGVVLLTHIAFEDESRIYNARDLASQTHIPLPMVSKILKALTRGGVLESHRGMNGGYRLKRPSEEITVVDIIEALQGPIAITQCIDESTSACGIELLCPVRLNWQRINDVVRGALDGITLADMTRPWTKKNGPVESDGARHIRDGAGNASAAAEPSSLAAEANHSPEILEREKG
jgi:FeS assembly SUF system regulator